MHILYVSITAGNDIICSAEETTEHGYHGILSPSWDSESP